MENIYTLINNLRNAYADVAELSRAKRKRELAKVICGIEEDPYYINMIERSEDHARSDAG